MSRPWAFLPAAASAAAGVTARVRRIVRKASGCSSREKQNAMEESKKGRNEEKRESERRDVWPWVSGSGRREASSCEWTINAIREARPYRSRRRLPPHRRQVITKAAASAAAAAAARATASEGGAGDPDLASRRRSLPACSLARSSVRPLAQCPKSLLRFFPFCSEACAFVWNGRVLPRGPQATNEQPGPYALPPPPLFPV